MRILGRSPRRSWARRTSRGRSRRRQALPAAEELGPLVLPDLHVALDGLELRLVDAAAPSAPSGRARCRPAGLARGRRSARRTPRRRLVHGDAARRRAALAGRAEAAPHGAVDREVEVGVVHHHDDVLAAHLEVAVLEARGAGLGDLAADLRRAGERDDADVRWFMSGAADLAAAARHHVDDAARQAGLLEDLHQVHDETAACPSRA